MHCRKNYNQNAKEGRFYFPGYAALWFEMEGAQCDFAKEPLAIQNPAEQLERIMEWEEIHSFTDQCKKGLAPW